MTYHDDSVVQYLWLKDARSKPHCGEYIIKVGTLFLELPLLQLEASGLSMVNKYLMIVPTERTLQRGKLLL